MPATTSGNGSRGWLFCYRGEALAQPAAPAEEFAANLKEPIQMSIEGWRAEIDAIDSELLRLLNMRAQLAIKVGESKKVVGLSICDREREREVIKRACQANPGPLDERAIVKLFRRIIHESRSIEARVIEQSGLHRNGDLR